MADKSLSGEKSIVLTFPIWGGPIHSKRTRSSYTPLVLPPISTRPSKRGGNSYFLAVAHLNVTFWPLDHLCIYHFKQYSTEHNDGETGQPPLQYFEGCSYRLLLTITMGYDIGIGITGGIVGSVSDCIGTLFSRSELAHSSAA